MDAVTPLRRPEGELTIHTEGDRVQVRVDGVVVWHGSQGAWSFAISKPRGITPPPTFSPKVA